MIDDDLKRRIDGAIVAGKDVVDVLREFKSNGGTQKDALDTLKSVREKASEQYEDRVLEVMDIASGFCAPHSKIWQD